MADKSTSNTDEKKLYRSSINRMIGGVCAGVAEYFNIDVTLVRIVWVLSVFIHGLGVIAYLASLILMPENPEKQEIPEGEKAPPQNTGLIIGIALVVIGLMMLPIMNHRMIFDWPFFHFWPFNPSIFLPVLLILFGILYIVHIVRKEKQQKAEGGETVKGQGSRKLFRSLSNKMISGVCSGLAKYWDIDVSLVRVGWVIATILTGFWLGIVAYIIMIFAVQEEEPQPIVESVTETKTKTTKSRKVSKDDDKE